MTITDLAPGMTVGHVNPELADWRGTITTRRNGTWYDRLGYVSVKWHEGTVSQGVPLQPGLTWVTADALTIAEIAGPEPVTRCAECGQATDGQCVFCHRRVCLDCSEGSKHRCPGLDGQLNDRNEYADCVS